MKRTANPSDDQPATRYGVGLPSGSLSSEEACDRSRTAAEPVITAPPMSASGSVQLDVQSITSPLSGELGARFMPTTEHAASSSASIAARAERTGRARGTVFIYDHAAEPVHPLHHRVRHRSRQAHPRAAGSRRGGRYPPALLPRALSRARAPLARRK